MVSDTGVSYGKVREVLREVVLLVVRYSELQSVLASVQIAPSHDAGFVSDHVAECVSGKILIRQIPVEDTVKGFSQVVVERCHVNYSYGAYFA